MQSTRSALVETKHSLLHSLQICITKTIFVIMVMSPTRSLSLFETYNVSVTGQNKFEAKFFPPGIRFKNLQSKIHFGKPTNLRRKLFSF